jgi:uncharacterized protein YqhQ
MSTESRPYIGGQAVIEGVMMRSPGSMSIVCRRRSGELVVRERPMPPVEKVGPRGWPLVRGVATLVDALRMGQSALRWSAELYEADYPEEAPAKDAKGAGSALWAFSIGLFTLLTQDPQAAGEDAPAGDGGSKKGSSWMSLVSILLAVGLFVALPQLTAEGLSRLFRLDLPVTSPGYQALTGAAKLTIVVGYMLMLRRTEIGKRLFEYHGAEHKTISTYEAGEDLVVENARPKTTAHPRCGTTFLVMVALVSILLFSILGAFLPTLPGGRLGQFAGFFLLKLPFLPVIAAVTYEIQRVFARYCTTGPLRALLWPGFLVQKITTAEPDDAQLEVALASLRATLWREAARQAPAPADRTFSGYGELIADPGYQGA